MFIISVIPISNTESIHSLHIVHIFCVIYLKTVSYTILNLRTYCKISNDFRNLISVFSAKETRDKKLDFHMKLNEFLRDYLALYDPGAASTPCRERQPH